MVVHAAHSDLCKTDVETLKDELRRRNMPSAHILNTTYQQVPDVNRSLTSPCSPPDQRSPQSTLDNKLLPTPPAYTPSPLSTVAAAAAAGNFPAAIAALAATQTANPFLLAAALGLQQPQNASSTLPWISNAQSFTAMLPYFQHLQAQVQQQAQAQVALAQQIAAQQAANLHQQFKTVAAAAAAAHTSLLSQQQQQHQQQTQLHSQWLSPPPSVPPQISATKQTTTCPSPLLPSGAELTSSLLEFTELSPRLHPEPQPPSPPASSSSSLYNDEKQQQLQQQQFLFDEDLMIDSLMEERKDLSEKESIAVAVLAGMAACQR